MSPARPPVEPAAAGSGSLELEEILRAAGVPASQMSPEMARELGQVLRIVVQGHRAATLSVDGRNLGELGEGDAITCTAAERSARLVTFGPRDFLQILKTKFGLNDR